jgi:hypothetical protein
VDIDETTTAASLGVEDLFPPRFREVAYRDLPGGLRVKLERLSGLPAVEDKR